MTRLRVVTAASIPQTPLSLIWRQRLIVGAVNLIAGHPGAGKSTLAALIAAELTRHGKTVVVSNCEDDPASVTLPRLAVAGAILERVHVIAPEDAPLLPGQLGELEHVIQATRAACLVLDPVAAHFQPERLAHDRGTLRRLAGVARATGCAVLAVHHTTKTGSVGGPNSGLLGSSRAVYVYGFDPDDEDRRALSCEKINGAETPPTVLFEHDVVEYEAAGASIEAGRLRRVRDSNATARQTRGKRNAERDAACHAWLSEYLAAGKDCARGSNEVKTAGRDAGFAQATLQRAKTRLQVEHYRVGGWGADGHWTWRLPDAHPLRSQQTEEPAP